MGKALVFLRGGLGLDGLRLVDQRADYEGLPPCFDLLANEAVGRIPLIRLQPFGLDLLASGGHLVDG